MNKIALALACTVMAISAPLAPASAQGCGKSDWTYGVYGFGTGPGYLLPGLVEYLGGPSGLSFQQAVQWLGTHGYRVTVVYRGCSCE